ncbi:5037_t:CDS:2, partial [Funneliformis geosporum]
ALLNNLQHLNINFTQHTNDLFCIKGGQTPISYIIPINNKDLKTLTFGSLAQISTPPNWYLRLQQKVVDNPVYTNRLLLQFASDSSHLS